MCLAATTLAEHESPRREISHEGSTSITTIKLATAAVDGVGEEDRCRQLLLSVVVVVRIDCDVNNWNRSNHDKKRGDQCEQNRKEKDTQPYRLAISIRATFVIMTTNGLPLSLAIDIEGIDNPVLAGKRNSLIIEDNRVQRIPVDPEAVRAKTHLPLPKARAAKPRCYSECAAAEVVVNRPPVSFSIGSTAAVGPADTSSGPPSSGPSTDRSDVDKNNRRDREVHLDIGRLAATASASDVHVARCETTTTMLLNDSGDESDADERYHSARSVLANKTKVKDGETNGLIEMELLGSPDSQRHSPDGASNDDDQPTERSLVAEEDDLLASDKAVLIKRRKPGATDVAIVDTALHDDNESGLAIFSQVVFPFLIAGCGMVGAGYCLDIVQHWTVFVQVPELFILVPALLGLKGNLEMTLASRLSTLSNLGKMDNPEDKWRIIMANLALIQAQAAVVGFLASVAAVVLNWVQNGTVDFNHAAIMCASSLTTASLASFVLGVVMVVVIVASRAWHINPDNVATPIAASLGDLTTLAFLSIFGMNFYWAHWTVNLGVVIAFVCSVPLWIYLGAKEPTTKRVLETGWTPVIMAMLISSSGGFILKMAVAKFSGLAVYQPVINGVAGNLAAVAASRLSTHLHRTQVLGASPVTCCAATDPFTAFFGPDSASRAARVLLCLVPGHIVFNAIIYAVGAGSTTPTVLFTTVYVGAAFLQVSFLLWICRWMVYSMWSVGVDPDNSAIPYLTALGDLLGGSLLAGAFAILDAAGEIVD